MKYFSTVLESLLKEKGIMQKKLCADLGVSKNQLHYWIKNKAEPDLEILTEIAAYFEVSTDFLLGLEDEFGNKIKLRKT